MLRDLGPDSFSVLLNFHLQGREVFDPFFQSGKVAIEKF